MRAVSCSVADGHCHATVDEFTLSFDGHKVFALAQLRATFPESSEDIRARRKEFDKFLLKENPVV